VKPGTAVRFNAKATRISQALTEEYKAKSFTDGQIDLNPWNAKT
jgi:hypothetical protein